VIRVLADANVLISAALARDPRTPSVLIFEAALDGRVGLVSSPGLLGEVASVLARPRLRRYLSLEEAQRFVAGLAALTTVTADPPAPHPAVCRDAADDYLVALSRMTDVDAIVSGDLDLLSIENLDPPALTPRDFLDRLRREP
jgi:putative PIN family toxin of toxin-antitoxin system